MEILHVEDDDAMAVAFRAAVDEAGIQVIVKRVVDGEQALEYLHREGLYSRAERPALVFLDLNMPRVDGWQVLTEMRAEEELRSIPVVILSTSNRRADQERAKALGARQYIEKPPSFTALIAAVGAAYRQLGASA
jgi:CheY-like chemotaxis protein